MQKIQQSVNVITPLDRESILRHLEYCGRVCYQSHDRTTEGSAARFATMLMGRNHQSVIEHYSLTVEFITNRGVTHELVRHRLASYSQESTRYVTYDDEMPVIDVWPDILTVHPNRMEAAVYVYELWEQQMQAAERTYKEMLFRGVPAEIARGVLPNDLKTHIVATANLREWIHICEMRCAKGAHPQIRRLMTELLRQLQEALPELFSQIKYY